MTPPPRSRIRDLLHSNVGLPSPPAVYDRLVRVLDHPRSGSADIAQVITEDPSLTARLLRIVNSALFGFPKPIKTITQAVRVVGTNQIRDLALATSVTTLFRDLPKEVIDLSSFWRHSLGCAVVARLIASHRREPNVESFFLCGLMHDIGRLVIYTNAGAEASKALLLSIQEGAPLHTCEKAVFTFDHAQVGAVLMDEWKFPAMYREAVAFHHRPSFAGTFPLETAAVHVADIIVNAAQWGFSGEQKIPPHDPSAWEILGLDVNLLPSLMEMAERQLDEIIDLTSAA